MQNQTVLEVLTTSDAARWKAVLDEIGVYDSYHLPSYHRLAEIRGEGEAVMPVFRQDGYVIAFPMLLRDIDTPAAEVGEGLKDATSVYGFPGPVSSAPDIPEEVAYRYGLFLQEFFASRKVVAAFSRLNPLLKQSDILAKRGETVHLGPTVSIDLTLPEEAQRAQYRRCHRVDIGRLKEAGFVCEKVDGEYLEDFMRVYYETMDRAHAEPYYYFDRAYFEYMMNEMADATSLFICRQGKTVVCSALVLVCNGIIEGHLTGTANAYIRLAPMKLMMDALREWGNETGAHTFHVGGGVGGKADSLLFFKRGFSDREHDYRIWRHIVDPEVYEELFADMRARTGIEPEGFYFPAYRHPSFRNAEVSESQ